MHPYAHMHGHESDVDASSEEEEEEKEEIEMERPVKKRKGPPGGKACREEGCDSGLRQAGYV